MRGCAWGNEMYQWLRADCLTRFIRTLRLSKEFRTKGGFLDRVELSLSLRFSCKKKVMGVHEGPSASGRHTGA